MIVKNCLYVKFIWEIYCFRFSCSNFVQGTSTNIVDSLLINKSRPKRKKIKWEKFIFIKRKKEGDVHVSWPRSLQGATIGKRSLLVIIIARLAERTWCFEIDSVGSGRSEPWKSLSKLETSVSQAPVSCSTPQTKPVAIYICSNLQHQHTVRRSSVSRFVIYFLVYDIFIKFSFFSSLAFLERCSLCVWMRVSWAEAKTVNTPLQNIFFMSNETHTPRKAHKARRVKRFSVCFKYPFSRLTLA